PAVVEAFEDFGGLFINAAVHASLREVVVELAHSLLQRLRLVGIWLRDVTESCKLLEGSLGIRRRDLLVRRVHAVVPIDLVPTTNAPDGSRFVLVDVYQNLAIHVFANWQTEQVQKCGTDIEEIGSVDAIVLLNIRPFGNKDPELTMLDSWASRFAWDSGWPQMIGMETVVRHKNDGDIVSRELEKRGQHQVVVAVSSFQAVLENAEVPVVDVILFRRVIPHE